MSTAPTIGCIVHYQLTQADADTINRRRHDATQNTHRHRDGMQVHAGNSVQADDVYPMVITRVWGDQPDSCVNGQVLLDGTDTYWVSSVQAGDGPRSYSWPTRS